MSGVLARKTLVVGLLVAGGALGWQWWHSPERRIARILAAVDSALTHDEPGTGLAAVAAAASLQPHLAPEIAVETGGPSGVITGRQEVIALAARARSAGPAMHLQWFDPDIELHGETRATVRATAQVTMTSASGEETVDVHQVEGRVEERDGEWVVVTARRRQTAEPGR